MDLANEVDLQLIKGAVKELNKSSQPLENPFNDEDVRHAITTAAISYITPIAAILTKCAQWLMLIVTIIIIVMVVLACFFGKRIKKAPTCNYVLGITTFSVTIFFTTTTAAIEYRKNLPDLQNTSDTSDIKSAHIFVFYSIIITICGLIIISTYYRQYPIYKYTTVALYWIFSIYTIVIIIVVCSAEEAKISAIHFVVLMTLLVAAFMMIVCGQMLKGKHKYAFSPEDYVFGAICVYLSGGVIMLIVVRILLKRDSVREQAIGAVVGCC